MTSASSFVARSPGTHAFHNAASGRAPDRRFVVDAGDVQLACKAWGRPDQPTVVLVHGYPDSSEVWHAVATDLANDFHVVAYDVRGAGESTAPSGIQAYRLERLSLDFEAVINQVSPHAPV
ncbi:MAG: alpha/beta fold hydrolase, partial [Pseudomonadota bacterium]